MIGHPDLGPLEEAASDELPGRASLLEHLRRCAECRSRVAERNPTSLFALLALDPVPPEISERVSAGVAAALDAGRGAGRARRQGLAWMPLAAALLLAGLLGTYLGSDRGAVMSEAPRIAQPAPRFQEAVPAAASAAPAGMIQLLSSPGTAEVLELSFGDTELVMIFDEGFDL